MSGIHAVLTKPTEVHTAVWNPTDEQQRGIVLGWLKTIFPGSEFEIGDSMQGLHFYSGSDNVYVAPGDSILYDPETGVLGSCNTYEFSEMFDYDRVLADPNQPALFDLIID